MTQDASNKAGGEPDAAARIAALERALAAKSRLVATVSHELRTPMGAVIAMADLLLDTELSGTQKHFAATLKQSAFGLLAILNDILDHEKLEAGRFTLSPQDFSPRKLVEDVCAAHRARAEARGLALRATIAPDMAGKVHGDPARLRQILDNLLDNAVKFTVAGEIAVHAESEKTGAGRLLRLAVADTGCGIADNLKAEIFAPFAQGPASGSGDHAGTGLGLAISARLATAMGGAMSCTSQEHAGSRFEFTVACKEPQTTGAEEPAARPRKTGRTGHILVVEDNRINQMLITTYLEKFGHSFAVCASGEEAVAEMKRKRKAPPFDLVLMDIHMPGIDGLEATRRIRQLPAGRDVPVVALTANAMEEDRRACLAAGMNAFLPKPIIAADFFMTIQKLIGAETPEDGRSNATDAA